MSSLSKAIDNLDRAIRGEELNKFNVVGNNAREMQELAEYIKNNGLGSGNSSNINSSEIQYMVANNYDDEIFNKNLLEQGYIGSKDGANNNDATLGSCRIRTKTLISPKAKKVVCGAGFKVMAYIFSKQNVYQGYNGSWLDEFEFDNKSFNYKLVFKRENDTAITPNDSDLDIKIYTRNAVEKYSSLVEDKPLYKEINNLQDNLTLTAPNGERYKVSVGNTGTLSATKIEENVNTDRVLIFRDEFDGKTLDMSKWRYLVGLRYLDDGVTPKQAYPLDQSENVFIKDSILHLKAIRNNPYPGFEWSAAFIETNNLFEFKYGRIEAKMKFSGVKGSYASFWTLGADYDKTQELINGEGNSGVGMWWPKCGEVDIAEFNSTGSPACNMHYGLYKSQHRQVGGTTLDVSDASEWHIYAMEWDETNAKFYVDDTLKKTVTIADLTVSGYNCFTKPHFLMFNSGVATASGLTPAEDVDELETQVDWVRVYAPTTVTEVTPPTAVALNKTSTSLVKDTYEFLTATFTPSTATDMTLDWYSSDETVAMCYGGKITAIGVGTCKVFAKTNNNIKVECEVTVTES